MTFDQADLGRFLPMTRQELKQKGIARPDVILVTGDAYIDSSFSGTAIIGRVLEAAGYRVAVISQPDINSRDDICSLGQPGLFWGITSGCVDSEVANYTALGKPRRHCDFTPGGANSRRPDRACIAYSNLIRRYFKNTVPLVLGGIEASLRRTAHYDQRTDSIRRSILLDAKADILVYGMGETQCL
ncbi:MAG: YgiQ family radical SAM protein, partial [Desulfonatronovibrionaceae bacterium]